MLSLSQIIAVPEGVMLAVTVHDVPPEAEIKY